MCIIKVVSKLKVKRRYKASDVGKVINLIGHHAGRYFSVSYRVHTIIVHKLHHNFCFQFMEIFRLQNHT